SLHVVIGHSPVRRWLRDEPVRVVVLTFVIEISQKRQFVRVSLPNYILPENVGCINLLRTPAELVEIGIGVLLQHVESGDVVLPAVVVVIAENTNTEIGVVENEAAEIADERLNAGANGNEIVVVRQIAQVNFAECFLERIEFLFACGAILRIWIHHVPLFYVEVVMIVNAKHSQRPIDRLERGFAFEKIDPDRKIVRVKQLIAPSEELGAIRESRAHAAWSW